MYTEAEVDALEAAIPLIAGAEYEAKRVVTSRGRTAVQKTALLGSFVARNGGAIFIPIFYAHNYSKQH